MKIFYFFLIIIFAFFIVTFGLSNLQPVPIKYYLLDKPIVDLVLPGYMLIFASLLVGVVITWFLGAMERFRLNRTISKQNKMIRDLRKELRAGEAPPMIEEKKKSI